MINLEFGELTLFLTFEYEDIETCLSFIDFVEQKIKTEKTIDGIWIEMQQEAIQRLKDLKYFESLC